MRQLFLSIILCVCTSSVFSQYLAVVDAGSSGSRVHVYAIADGVVTDITPLNTSSIKPALSSLSTDSTTVRQYAADLVAPISKVVDHDHVIRPTDVDFYLYATAGMRLVPPSQSSKIYAELRDILREDGFAKVTVETITGKMEGVYDWLALNYLKHTLSSSGENTYGVMDMGGASTEIVFATRDRIPHKDKFSITLNNHTYHLYSHSYLGLGQDVARSQYTEDANCFPVNYPLPNGLKGAGHFDACVENIDALMHNVHHIKLPEAAHASRFYVLSGLYYIAMDKPFGFSDVLPLSEFFKKTSDLCHTDWNKLQISYPGNNYLYSYCFAGALYNALLIQNYHFSDHEQLTIPTIAESEALSWTMGVAVLQSTKGVD